LLACVYIGCPNGVLRMTNESLSATVTIKAPAETVFAIIADPA
jgi:hypothetical protein